MPPKKTIAKKSTKAAPTKEVTAASAKKVPAASSGGAVVSIEACKS